MRGKVGVWAIFAVVTALLGLLYIGLGLDSRKLPSPLVGKLAPDFELEVLQDPSQTFSRAELLGQVAIVNVWASWCTTCRAERPYLVDLGRRSGVPIYAFNFKDNRADALNYLKAAGNPYVKIGFDPDAEAGIEWGVYATPETYILDAKGIIRYKHIGPLHPQIIKQEILPLLDILKNEARGSA